MKFPSEGLRFEKAAALRNKHLSDDEVVKQDGICVSISKNRDSGYRSGAQRETNNRSETTSGSSSSSTSTNTVEKNTTTVDEDTEQKSTLDVEGTSSYEDLIRILESDLDNVNYKKLLEIIDENGITDFTYQVMMSIVDSDVSGEIEGASYILGNNFEYLAEYNGVSSYANFYTLVVDGEVTLIRVGRDKTQVGFYDIVNTDFFTQAFDERNANDIFELYLPTSGLDTNLNDNKILINDEYKFYDNKASNTTDVFWKNLSSDSTVMKQLALGLDTIRGSDDNGTGIASDFGEVYQATEYYSEKNNALVLGEIYGHADGLNQFNWFNIAGDNKYRYWVADVENPNTISTALGTRIRQGQQNDRWESYAEGR